MRSTFKSLSIRKIPRQRIASYYLSLSVFVCVCVCVCLAMLVTSCGCDGCSAAAHRGGHQCVIKLACTLLCPQSAHPSRPRLLQRALSLPFPNAALRCHSRLYRTLMLPLQLPRIPIQPSQHERALELTIEALRSHSPLSHPAPHPLPSQAQHTASTSSSVASHRTTPPSPRRTTRLGHLHGLRGHPRCFRF